MIWFIGLAVFAVFQFFFLVILCNIGSSKRVEQRGGYQPTIHQPNGGELGSSKFAPPPKKD